MEKKLNSILFRNNLAIIPNYANSKIETGNYKNGGTYYKAQVQIEFEIIDAETGYSVTKCFVGSDIDANGKELAQAITEACKRFYFKLFHIAEGEEKDYPKTLEIRNTEGGMIWQVYHVNSKPEAWILSLNADKNGFECRTLTDHQPEEGETWKDWRDKADFLN